LHHHAKKCWGDETIKAAINTKDLKAAQTIIEKSPLRNRSITAAFERIRKEKVTFSHHQHTYQEMRYGQLFFLYPTD
jgi:hypothetical protein